MPGPPPKDPERRQRRNSARPHFAIVPVDDRPAPPTAWGRETSVAWDRFWGSPAASLVRPEALAPIQRLFSLYDERERSVRAYRKARFVLGSRGQVRLNPIAGQLNRLEHQILALENVFGLSPKAALGLGIQPLTPGRTLEDLNIAATLSAAEDPGEDPRDALIEWQAEQARARRGETDAQEG